jgi:hypothetical protein
VSTTAVPRSSRRIPDAAALDQLADALVALLARRWRDASTDSAGSARSLASAIDATTPAPSRPKATRAPLEDADRGHATNRTI